jgi:hypothetical protein
MPSIAPSTPTPLDPHERRAEWRFALLVLALVAAQGGTVTDEGSVVAPSAGPRRREVRPTGSARRTGRLVRPPRSC